MKYNGVLIAVSDMENSRRFYSDVLGLKVVEDFGANVTLEGGIFLQTLDTWKTFIQSDQIVLPNHAGELYFEEEDIEGFCGRLASIDVRYDAEALRAGLKIRKGKKVYHKAILGG